ncbi:MAG: hypothetical protein M1834_002312 [Cirrosporium novae-zelandiae]|nr:MAG: hypothetical protein M1834_002312 [Cirrosporium novae-zelandiae]
MDIFHSSVSINFEDLPSSEDDPEFKSWVTHVLEPKSHDLKQESSTQNPDAYASFGDQGTTASVSAYGKILRTSSYLGGKQSQPGIFALDFAEAEEAYSVDARAQSFQEAVSDPNKGFGLRIRTLEHLEPGTPELEFLGERWPRITYDANGLSIEIQMLINNGITIQDFKVTNRSSSSANFDIILDINFDIQELDYMT